MFWSESPRLYRGKGEVREWFRRVLEPWESFHAEPDKIREASDGRILVGGTITARGKGSGAETSSQSPWMKTTGALPLPFAWWTCWDSRSVTAMRAGSFRGGEVSSSCHGGSPSGYGFLLKGPDPTLRRLRHGSKPRFEQLVLTAAGKPAGLPAAWGFGRTALLLVQKRRSEDGRGLTH
jgi:hypothetical protein